MRPGRGGPLGPHSLTKFGELVDNIVKVGSHMDDMACESRYKLLCKAIARCVQKQNRTRQHDEWSMGSKGNKKAADVARGTTIKK